MSPGQDSAHEESLASAAYEQHEAALRRYLRNRLRNGEDARELSQEVWARLLRVADPARVHSPRAYLYRVAANVVAEFRHLRKRDPVRFDSEAFAVAAEGPDCAATEDAADGLARASDVYRLLSTLPRTYRKIVLLRICDGCSFESIGQRLGLSAGTAERYCQSALTQIRRRYGNER
jgi:RNA polymerase sigma factor (sigma-70 family)